MNQPLSVPEIEREKDPLIKALLLAALVSKGFSERGFNAVVMGAFSYPEEATNAEMLTSVK